MSRSGYGEDYENLALYRNAVRRAIYGKRGQAFLREMAAALDAMPVKELIAGELVRDEAHVCAIGSVALARRMNVTHLNAYDTDEVADRFGIANALAAEIAYENDERGSRRGAETPAERWTRMREWVRENTRDVQPTTSDAPGEG